ncbi:hypothetical protein NMY22_g1336 [Coprinellus aureogranulatus]|nr:hypothetical protein NMY22_g1336 [Coprinellus aureogranulatus]
MFAAMRSAPSSAGPQYGAGPSAPGSKSYAAGSSVPARFAVHMFQKPAFGSYYPPPNNVSPMKMDAVGYRPSMPQQPQYAVPARYDDRYSPPHSHPQPPRLNTAPSNLPPRNYDPKPVPVSIPAGPPPPQRVAPNFSIYPTGALDTFIYEQSQGSKSDLLSTSEFDSQASPTESISSTVTLRGADTPGTETSSLEPSPVEPSHSRRNSIVFNGE